MSNFIACHFDSAYILISEVFASASSFIESSNKSEERFFASEVIFHDKKLLRFRIPINNSCGFMLVSLCNSNFYSGDNIIYVDATLDSGWICARISTSFLESLSQLATGQTETYNYGRRRTKTHKQSYKDITFNTLCSGLFYNLSPFKYFLGEFVL